MTIVLSKTPVSRLECYYLVGLPEQLELHDLHAIDFEEAVAVRPNDWAPVEEYGTHAAYEMPVGPDAPTIVDKRNHPIFPTIQEMSSKPPPMASANPRPVGDTVRQPVKKGRNI